LFGKECNWAHARRRNRNAGSNGAPPGIGVFGADRLFLRPRGTAERLMACGAPVVISRCLRMCVPSRRRGGTEARSTPLWKKVSGMLQVVADSIAKDAQEVFRQLDVIQGGIAELKKSKKDASNGPSFHPKRSEVVLACQAGQRWKIVSGEGGVSGNHAAQGGDSGSCAWRFAEKPAWAQRF